MEKCNRIVRRRPGACCVDSCREWGAFWMPRTRALALSLFIVGGIICAAVPSTAFGDWTFLMAVKDVDWYFDETLTRKRGTMAKVWTLQDYKTAQPLYGGEYQSIKMQAEIRCHSNQWRVFYFVYHAGPMGTGDAVYIQETAGAWKSVEPDTYAEALFNTGCHPEPP